MTNFCQQILASLGSYTLAFTVFLIIKPHKHFLSLNVSDKPNNCDPSANDERTCFTRLEHYYLYIKCTYVMYSSEPYST